tara:strand:+ start:1378 stop:1839 length:462 start_codon:yes stop_codon:yes gene_type:complete
MKLNDIFEDVSNETQFQIKDREDDTYITAYSGAKIYGNMVINWVSAGGYKYEFEGSLGEDEYYELFPDDRFALIVQLRVDERYRGGGYAKELMNKTLSLIKERGYDRVYLNANPMGFGGLDVNDLVGFYQKFGFQIIPSLDKWADNKEMYLAL